jgi:hypothetical protein
MTHLSLPKDITSEQMFDVVAVIEKGLPLDSEQKTDLELDAMTLLTYAGDNSRIGYVRALARLVNSGMY